MAYNLPFTIARRRENKNGKTYWKGVIDMEGQKMTITVFPAESGENAKITVAKWRSGGSMYKRYSRYSR
jgi:hypothetical protein